MNDRSKLNLSDEELQLVTSRDWILTKRTIIDKVYGLFGELSVSMKTALEEESGWLPPEVVRTGPKISRGENYLLLPYVMLDYPRFFHSGNTFAVRTMFWWGNFFSITLQLAGRYKDRFAENMLKNKDQLLQKDLFICVNEDPWQHHFESNNYSPAKDLSSNELEKMIKHNPFVKLALKFPLLQWENINELLEESFVGMMKLLKA